MFTVFIFYQNILIYVRKIEDEDEAWGHAEDLVKNVIKGVVVGITRGDKILPPPRKTKSSFIV